MFVCKPSNDDACPSGKGSRALSGLSRVPVQTLLDYLAGGHPLEEFLDDFPTVAREQATALLYKLEESLETAQI